MSLLTFSVAWLLILYYPIRIASSVITEGQQSAEAFRIFEFFGFDALLAWAIPEFGIVWHVALLIFPSLSLFVGADQTCSDREHGTLRIITLRSTRNRVFFGRFAGTMLVQALLILVALCSTLVLVIARDPALLSTGLNNMLALFVNLFITVLPFTAMMATLSTSLKTSRQVTVWAILILSVVSWSINLFAQQQPLLSYLKMLIPGYQLAEMQQLAQWDALQIAYIPLTQTILLLIIGRWIHSRQAI